MPPQRPRTPKSYLDSQKGKARNTAAELGATAGELLALHFHRRLIARVFHGPGADNWVLKGGQALLVRWQTARYSTDVDLLSTEQTTDAAVAALIAAAAQRLNDEIWFAHRSTSAQTHADRPTRKVVFMAMFEQAPLGHLVSVDVVAATHRPRGAITTEPLQPAFATDCAPWPAARVYPVEDHVADKICAMYELYRTGGNPSTRYKDLVDLALFAVKTTLPGAETHRILWDEVAVRRGRGMVLELPATFTVPDPRSWAGGYRQVARNVRDLPEELRTLEGVHLLADAFITPLLQPDPPAGRWRPADRTWR
jgi:predicted nucleotidyltransferase component of viral defense system